MIWEYRVLRIEEADTADDLEDQLNTAGQDGWEAFGTDLPWVYLKRPVPQHRSITFSSGVIPDKNW